MNETFRRPVEVTVRYNPLQAMPLNEVLKRINEQCDCGATLIFGKSHYVGRHVVFTPQGWRELRAIFHWGMEHPDNQYEQQARLLGHMFKDGNGETTTVVCYAQPIYPASRTPVSASIIETDAPDGTADVSMYRMLNSNLGYINKCDPIARCRSIYKELDPFYSEKLPVVVVGLAHTHPHMSCFASMPDRQTHGAAKGQPFISLIVNPQAKNMYAIMGYEMDEAKITVYDEPKTAQAYSIGEKREEQEVTQKTDKIAGSAISRKKTRRFKPGQKMIYLIATIQALAIFALIIGMFLIFQPTEGKVQSEELFRGEEQDKVIPKVSVEPTRGSYTTISPIDETSDSAIPDASVEYNSGPETTISPLDETSDSALPEVSVDPTLGFKKAESLINETSTAGGPSQGASIIDEHETF